MSYRNKLLEGLGVPLASNAGGVALSATSPRPDYRACGLSAAIAHAEILGNIARSQ